MKPEPFYSPLPSLYYNKRAFPTSALLILLAGSAVLLRSTATAVLSTVLDAALI
jgi:hypothetical protein